MKILVCGGRDYNNITKITETLEFLSKALTPITEIIEGGASGVDMHAGNWAEQKQIKHTVFTADWEKHGKAAGPIRNKQMLDVGQPTMVVAFPGGKGTANMVKLAQEAEIGVYLVL